MKYKSYQHIEKLGTSEVQDIEYGVCHVFPKIDGTNASIWLSDDGTIKAGSRRRELTLEDDNAGFYAWVLEQENIKSFFSFNPDVRLFGEWLVPHSLKTYRNEAWKNFYVFDVCKDGENDTVIHVPYDEYKPILEVHGINYVPPICAIKNGSYDQFINQLALNVFLIEDGKGAGEEIFQCYKAIGMQAWEDDFSKENFLNTFSPTRISDDDMRYGQSYYYIIVDHLRGLGFDMGYGQIESLIEANLAININK